MTIRTHAAFAPTTMLLLACALSALVAAACGGASKPGHRERIVYEAGDGAATNIFTMDPTTGATTQLTRTQTFDGNPGWSPDRRRIVFTSDRANAKDNHIYVMDADGANATAVTSAPDTSDWSPKFSPDSKRIVYASRSAGDGNYRLLLIDADGSNPRELTGPYTFAEFPAWTPDGKEVYFAGIAKGKNDLDIYSVDPANGEVVTRISTPGGDLCPHFSRDGKYLTYATSVSGDEKNVDLFRHEVSSSDTTGASDERLTNSGGFDDYANASPDDKQYVFVSERDSDFELYLMDRDGSNPRRLTNTPGMRENVPDW